MHTYQRGSGDIGVDQRLADVRALSVAGGVAAPHEAAHQMAIGGTLDLKRRARRAYLQ